MRINQEFASPAASSANISIGSGHVNGIVINSNEPNLKITARLRHATGSEVIIPNLPLWGAVMNITDFMFGAGGLFGHMVSRALQAYAPTAEDDVHDLQYTETGYRIKLEFGSIFLGSGAELLVDIVSPAPTFLQIASYSDDKRPAEVITWEATSDTNASFAGSQAVFAQIGDFAGAPDSAKGYEVDYKVKDNTDTGFVGHNLAHVATATTGRYEVSPPQGFAMLWLNTDAVYDTVDVTVSGNQSRNVQLICIRKKFLAATV